MVFVNPYVAEQQQRQLEILTDSGKVIIDKKNILSVKPLRETNGAIILLKDYSALEKQQVTVYEPYADLLKRMYQS